MQGATCDFVSSLYEETKPQRHNDARLATHELQIRGQTQFGNEIYCSARPYVYAPFEVFQFEKCSSPDLDECRKIYSERNEIVSLRPLCVRERSSISSSLPRYPLKDIKRSKMHAMQQNNIGYHN